MRDCTAACSLVKMSGCLFLDAGHVFKRLQLFKKWMAGFAWMVVARLLVAALKIDLSWKWMDASSWWLATSSNAAGVFRNEWLVYFWRCWHVHWDWVFDCRFLGYVLRFLFSRWAAFCSALPANWRHSEEVVLTACCASWPHDSAWPGETFWPCRRPYSHARSPRGNPPLLGISRGAFACAYSILSGLA